MTSVVVSGLPGSGKSTVARQIASYAGIAVLDKDDILEQLFDERGIGDAEWRSALSRKRRSPPRATGVRETICVSRLVVATPSIDDRHWHADGVAGSLYRAASSRSIAAQNPERT
jgi:adenylylsulfate kinase-like enzyme